MFNTEHQESSYGGPRISFSHDFVDTQQCSKHGGSYYKEAPVSSDFEFTVKNLNMRSADEIFLQGMLVPQKSCESNNRFRKMTLRDELLVEDDCEDVLPRMSNGIGRWRERWGLKKSQIVGRKGDQVEGNLETVTEERTSIFAFTGKK